MTKLNPYVYAGDDPINMVDPTGRDWYMKFGSCLASAIMAPILALSGVIGTIGGMAMGFIQLASTAAVAAGEAAITAPVWLPWLTLIAGAIFLGVVVACAASATFY